MDFGFELIVILIMIAINAVLAAYEMALASVTRARLAVLCQEKKKGAEDAAFMKDRMEASLAVVQLGITLTGALAAATGGAGAHESLTPYFSGIGLSDFQAELLSLICLVIPLSAFTIIFAELVPKMFALGNREAVCLTLSPFMRNMTWIAGPFVRFFEAAVKKIIGWAVKKPEAIASESVHELKAAAALARTEKLIGAQAEKIVISATQLSQRKLSDIMLDAGDISMIPVTDSLSEALIKAHMDMHTRFPVCEKGGKPQTIIGYLNFKDIINALKLSPENPSVKGITRPIKRLPASMTLSQALPEMMRDHAHIAILVSGEDKVVGMITLENIIEDLIGNIEDEFDRLPNYIQPCGGGWIMGGGVPIKTVAATLGVEIPVKDSAAGSPTFAQWVARKRGKDIKGGDPMVFEHMTVTVRKLRRRQVAEAFVAKAEGAASPTEK